jgi:hypothetical protein
VKRVMQGLCAGVIAGLAMNEYVRLIGWLTNGREAYDAADGRRRTGRGVQPAEAERQADDDATVRVGARAYDLVVGGQPDRSLRLRLGRVTHLGFSAVTGAAYALCSERVPAMRAGRGTLYGTLVWAVADEGIVPALGLSRPVWSRSLALQRFGLGGHWVYGLALDTLMRAARPTP